MKRPKHPWDSNRHTVEILKHYLWPTRVYWCDKCKRHVPARITPGERYALIRAIRKLGGHIKRGPSGETQG